MTVACSRFSQVVLIAAFALLNTPAAPYAPSDPSRTLLVGAYQNKPMIEIDETGSAHGLYPDLLDAIASNENWILTYVPCTFAECLEMLERGELDVMPSIAYSDQRRQQFNFSNQTVLVNWGQLYSRAGVKVDSILDLDGLRVAAVVDDIYRTELQQQMQQFGVTCEFADATDYQGVFDAIISGQVDAGITSRLFGTQNQESSKVSRGSLLCCPVELRFASPLGGDPLVLERIDADLAAWKDDPDSVYYDAINKVLSTPYASEVPDWIVHVALGAGGVLLLLIAGAWVLRLGVHARTQDLREEIEHRMRAEEAERSQRLLAEALAKTSSALSDILTLDEVLDLILSEADSVIPHDAGTILLLDRIAGTQTVDEGRLVARVVRSRGYDNLGLSTAVSDVSFPLGAAQNLLHMYQTGQPYILADTQTYPGWQRLPATEWIRSSAGAPIRVKGTIVGFLNLDSRIPGYFSSSHAQGLQAFADQAGTAIEKAQLYEQITDHASEMEHRVEERTSELRFANDSLRSAAERLRELDRLKSEFVSSVSHELRTPLTNIRSYLYLLEHGKAERREQYLRTLERETGLLQRLIEDLLHLSRLDLGKVAPDRRSVDLNNLVATLGDDRKMLVDQHGRDLVVELDSGLPQVETDGRMVTQILTNLLGNAMNFSDAGSKIVLFTRQGSDKDRDWVIVGVRDKGPGIPEDELPHIFERFYRGLAAQTGSVPGTGLGLSICLELATRLGGTIKADSRPGDGSEFTLWLPLEVATDSDTPPADSSDESRHGALSRSPV